MTILNVKLSKPLAVLLLIALWAGIYLPGLGNREIQGNEPKRMLPAMAMLENGNWITPELEGEQYYKKPPLINWFIAASFLISGNQSEFAARLPSAISVLCFALLLLLMPSGWLSYEGRFISAIAFLTSLGIIDMGRLIEIDAPYASITGMAILVWLNMRSQDYSKWLMWPLIGFILGLGVLLKGPLILVFFYLTAFFVLRYEKKLKELACLQHISGIIVMLAVFLSWAVPAYLMKPYNTAEIGKNTSMSAEWISDVLDNEIGMDKINFAAWGVNLLQALAYSLPWLLFLTVFLNRRRMQELPEDKKRLLKGMLMSTAIAFIMLSLSPGTRTRYFVPIISVYSISVGALLSAFTLKGAAENLWKKTLLVLSILSVCSLIAGIFLVNMRHIAFLLDLFKVKTTTPLEPAPFIAILATALIAGGVMSLIIHARKKYSGAANLSFLTALLIMSFTIQFACFILPIMKQFELKRPAGMAVNKFLPPNETVYLYNFGISNYQAFLYYVRPPVKYIFNDDDITGNVNYALFHADTYRRKLLEPRPFKRKPSVLTEVTLKRNKFVLVQFGEPLQQ